MGQRLKITPYRSMGAMIRIGLAVLSAMTLTAAAEDPLGTIVVTGTRPEQALKALRECLNHPCPPAEDMKLSAAAAEALFVRGDYKEARKVLWGTQRRNTRFAAQFPELVAGIHRGHARINQHLGENEKFERSTFDTVNALKAGLPETDLRVMLGRLEVANMLVRVKKLDRARRAYEALEADAQAGGFQALARTAKIRRAMLFINGKNDGKAERLLREVVSDNAPDASRTRLAARVLLVRLAQAQGQEPPVEELLAAVRAEAPAGLAKPTLLFSPALRLPNADHPRIEGCGGGGGGGLDQDMVCRTTASYGPTGGSFARVWLDLGYWILPNGAVEDVQVLRSDGRRDWHDSVLKTVAGRKYAPWSPPPGVDGQYHVVRYTFTSTMEQGIASNLRVRSTVPRVEVLDLTPANGIERSR